jgi:hypothetical protein
VVYRGHTPSVLCVSSLTPDDKDCCAKSMHLSRLPHCHGHFLLSLSRLLFPPTLQIFGSSLGEM